MRPRLVNKSGWPLLSSPASVKSVRILIPYFGSWPEWMNFFIESCKGNPTIDWLFFTDCGEPENRAPNVQYRHTTLADYCEHVSRALKVDFRRASGHKLVDIKPALGFLHADELAGYDFYGFGDIDVIYGDIRRFYTDEILGAHQLLSTHADRIAGHLALFENTSLMREAFRRILGWRDLLEDERTRVMDERQYTYLFRPRRRRKRWLRLVYSWITPLGRRLYFREQYSTILSSQRPWHDGSDVHPEEWIWRDGQLFNSADGEREFMYLHFMNWKGDRWLEGSGPAAWTTQGTILHMDWREAGRDGFRITPRGFEARNGTD